MIFDELELLGIIPVVTIDDEKKAVNVAKALCRGGINAAEITCRTDAAMKAIENIATDCPDMLLGAGTVLSTSQLDDAINAGAKFIVTPGFNPKIIKRSRQKNIPVLPGVNNPSNIEAALEMGIKTVKFFPAEASGGLKYIKALSGPYGMMKFIPTGGISLQNISEYVSFPKIAACGASFITEKALISDENYDEITRLAQETVKKVQGFEPLHVGIASTDEAEAAEKTAFFTDILGMTAKKNAASSFIDNLIEIVNFPGANHIGIGVNNVERSVFYLQNKGIDIDEKTKIYDHNRLNSVYLKKEISGFKIHLKLKNGHF